ncbi:hypothetical protein HMPREF3293_01264 [Christensenella minuta]|uniref:Uncharacterized protein n=1 Tax=Christensenella minuta TaxID=626937 RepID=A0A136Q5Q3_9FIRM|nr:hypothetical protein HMPREF3293_01264 [Christensenella minuta]
MIDAVSELFCFVTSGLKGKRFLTVPFQKRNKLKMDRNSILR